MKTIHELALKQCQKELEDARRILMGEVITRQEIGQTGRPACRMFEHLEKAKQWVNSVEEDNELQP